MTRRSLREFPFRVDVQAKIGELRSGDSMANLGAEQLKELIERSRGGEHIELEFDAVTYIQRATPNRNFIRFKDSTLRAMAKSGKGSPFLADHDQRSVAARAGTVTKSKAEKNLAGEWEFVQTFRVVKPWAVQGVLDGTIDRFSIGARPTGTVTYRHSGEEVEDWPRYWPGETIEDEDGESFRVEWVINGAELIETSAVNVPAVTGTSVLSDLRAELSAHLGGSPPELAAGAEPPAERQRMKKLLLSLGLSADASEESALVSVEHIVQNLAAQTKRADVAELELKSEREVHERTKAELAEHAARAKADATAKLDAKLAALYESGKLTRGHDGKALSADPYEETLREIHDVLGEAKFASAAARLTAKVPQGRQAGDKDPTPKATPGRFAMTPRLKAMAEQMGMTEEVFASNLEKGGTI